MKRILIIVIVALVVIVLSWYYISKKDTSSNETAAINAQANSNTNQSNTNTATNDNTNTANANTNQNTNTDTIDEIDTTSWSTYENTLYGYSLSYPSNWIDLNNIDVANPAMFSDETAFAQELVTELLFGSKIEIYVDVTSGESLTTLVNQILLDGFDEEQSVINDTDTIVDGVEARKVAVAGPQETQNITYLLQTNFLYNIIQYIPNEDDVALYTGEYNDILNTFKLTQ